ncbi:kinesin-like protein KIF12 isoform X2 [Bradysia coprophila]|uniref:kinesin-like protein KIF12 isoform X2 n=1 Tax=Bradysia coprophila TaxID=38358 RepID=UPI00187D88ED|nr:kinesin-like protein KIF12 isoform X2 [Bradysia coprophila]
MVVRSLSQSSLNKLTDKSSNKIMNRNRRSPSSPAQKPPSRSRSMNGLRSLSPSKMNGSLKSRGSSRGNEKSEFDYAETIATRSTDSAPSTPEDNINVVVRVRPLNDKEHRSNDPMVVQFPGSGQILCDGIPGGPSGGQKPKLFGYNVVFEPGASQDDVLQYSGIKRIIEMAIEGFSCTAFCYGQTGSGKTHTLTGPPDLFFGKKPDPSDDRHGLVFRAFLYLFQLLQERKDTNFVLKASFLEIYNEKVIDLLNAGSARKPLAVRWSKKSRGFFVENLFTVDCEELDDLLAVLEEGMRNRSVGSHRMNDYSSRSHTILSVHITSELQAENGVFISKQGKINFVDLAGSEMTKKTNSEGKTLEEANNINKSLMVLGYCIASLSDSKKRNGHIPYRDSKLTKLLADSLAGNGVTLMIACVSPAKSNISETLNTLRYAARAKKIRTKPIIVMDPREALILSLKREIKSLQLENDHLKSALNLHSEIFDNNALLDINQDRKVIPSAPAVDLEKMSELEIAEIVELVKLYVTENEALRNENTELFNTRDMILRDQEVVCRENERLLKKLEEVNFVCCRSPIIPARPAFSSEMLNMSTGSDTDSNIWTNPLNASTDNVSTQKSELLDGRVSSNENRIPDTIQKELDRRRIGDSITSIANSLRRNNSWDNQQTVMRKVTSKGSTDSKTNSPKLVDMIS